MDIAAKLDDMAKFTKQDIVDFAKKYYGNDYVVVYKRVGVDRGVVKVVKPEITPVEVNRDAQSEFVKTVLATPAPAIEPEFIDYAKQITTMQLKNGTPSGSCRRSAFTPGVLVGINAQVMPRSSPLPSRFSGSRKRNAKPMTVETAASVIQRLFQLRRI